MNSILLYSEFDPEAELDIVQGINGEAEVDTESPAMGIQQDCEDEGRKLFVLYIGSLILLI